MTDDALMRPILENKVAGVAVEGLPTPSILKQARITADRSISSWLLAEIAKIVARDVIVDLERLHDNSDPVVHIGPGLPSTRLPTMIWLHSTNAGIDPILRDCSWDNSILLTRTVGRMNRRIAEYVLGWILADAQGISKYLDQYREQVWQRQPLRLIEGDTAVVFGSGNMGRAVGKLLRGCGLKVIGMAARERQSDSFDQVVDSSGIVPFLHKARWWISTLPLTDATKRFFNDDIFGQAEGAYFINVGRAATVEPDALQRALSTGQVRGALLDVLEEEPPQIGSKWWKIPNTTLTPHTAGVTDPMDVLTDFRKCWEALQVRQSPPLRVDLERGY